MSSPIVKELRKLTEERAAFLAGGSLEDLRAPALDAESLAEAEITAAWECERKQKAGFRESLREDLRGRADWHRYCRQELEAAAKEREGKIREAGEKQREAEASLRQIKAREREGQELEERIRKLSRSKPRRNLEINEHYHAVTDPGPWSYSIQNLFEHNRNSILECFPKAGAPSTDALAMGGSFEYLEDMPHVRVLSGMLLHLERSHGRAVFQKPYSQMRFLLEKLGIERILEVGAGARGPLLWLARTGIPQELGIEMHAMDLRPLDEYTREWQDRQVEYVSADAFTLPETGMSYDLILSCGVLSPGGVADYLNYNGDKRDLETLEFLRIVDDRCHALARVMVGALSPNPAAAVLSASWYGSLGLRKEDLEKFSSIKLWQFSPSAEESDDLTIYGRNRPEHYASSREWRLFSSWLRDNEKMIDYGRNLLSGTKMAVFSSRHD